MITRRHGIRIRKISSSELHAFARVTTVAGLLIGCFSIGAAAAEPTRDEVRSALRRSVAFFRDRASIQGGYVYQWSADLEKREGEGKVGPTTAWIQPPATPAVAMAYLDAYRLCGEPALLEAATQSAQALIRGQLRSGGWDNHIEFDPVDRKKYAYRAEPNDPRDGRNTTTFDDDKSQSVIRFLIQLDGELEFNNPTIHESALYALDAVVRSQYACGAWPQRYSEFPKPSLETPRRASVPTQWSRTHPGSKYTHLYTLNDNTINDLIETMLDAWQVYDEAKYLSSALRGGDFLLLAQLPEPQPGWAQQYDRDMHPTWARKFEPPAITGGESQGVMRTLMMLYRRTATSTENAARFLEPLPGAIAYYRRSLLDDGRLARFYELGTNRPLFMTKDYQLTYSPDDLPTHYGFIVSSKIDSIESELTKIRETPLDRLWNAKHKDIPKRSRKRDELVSRIIGDLDSRGAWVETGRLRYHGDDDPTDRVIRSETFIRNVGVLAQWLAADMSD